MPSIFRRNVSRHKSAFTGNRKLNRARDKAAAGGIRHGFPIDEPFQSIEAVEEYLSGDMITCLICGNDKRALGNHLRMHGMTADDYKNKYAIPLCYGLDAADLTKRRTAIGLTRVKSGRGIFALTAEEKAAVSEKAARAPKRVSAGKRMVTVNRNRKYEDADYYKIPALMVEHDLPAEHVISAFDVPGKCVFYQRIKKDMEFKTAIDSAYEALSFAAQSKAQRLGERFRKAAQELRRLGLSYKQIGDRLGVDAMSVFNHLNNRVSVSFPYQEAEKWSERLDSNQRPLTPQESADG